MGFLARLRVGNGPVPSGRPPVPVYRQAGTAVAEISRRSTDTDSESVLRLSNGLKEFLSQLEGIGRGSLLDLGPARQATLNFFIDRGYKVYSEDLLTGWKRFLEDEQMSREFPRDADYLEMNTAARAERFLGETLRYPEASFDAVIFWDILDYLDVEAASLLVSRMALLTREGGSAMAMFHIRKPEVFSHYRIHDEQNLELVQAPFPVAPQHIYQNREISDLFRRFRSSKTFVGRDQLRETIFVR